MSESASSRRFFRELVSLLESAVNVIMTSGKTYSGVLKGFDVNTLSLVLADAKDNEGKMAHRVFINGNNIVELVKTEEPFDLGGLADELQKIFPPGEVKYLEDARVISILNKIRVTEEGVEGTGPIAERVRKVYEHYFEEKEAD
ncbi:MAG: Lsm family RNA-binding protein [Promethearchaeota archaeon]